MVFSVTDLEIERVRSQLIEMRSRIVVEENLHEIKREELKRKMNGFRRDHTRLLNARGVTSRTQSGYELYCQAVKEAHKEESVPAHILKLETTLCSMIHQIGNIHIQQKLIHEQSYNSTKEYRAIVGYQTEEGAKKEAELLRKIGEENSNITAIKTELTKINAEHTKAKAEQTYKRERMEWDESLNSFGGDILDETFLRAAFMEQSIDQETKDKKKSGEEKQTISDARLVFPTNIDEVWRNPCSIAA